jgi:hypothetical protein
MFCANMAVESASANTPGKSRRSMRGRRIDIVKLLGALEKQKEAPF